MTTQQKNKANTIFNLLYKIFVVLGVGGILLSIGEAKAELNQKTFDTVEDKVNTKNHVNNALSELEIYDLKNHIHNPDFHMPKKAKDSFYVTRPEFEELVGRNATTNYQTKEELREIKSIIKGMQQDIGVIVKKTSQ